MLTSANTLIKAIKQMWQRIESAKFASPRRTVGSFSCPASVYHSRRPHKAMEEGQLCA